MRRLLAAAALLAISMIALPAAAQTVTVTVGAEMKKKADLYGRAEIDRLARRLEQIVEREMARKGKTGRVELTLIDAQANRPTMKEMSDRPGLSIASIGLGGAAVDGTVITADGARTPIHIVWYETDFRDLGAVTTWTDAETVFRRVAVKAAG